MYHRVWNASIERRTLSYTCHEVRFFFLPSSFLSFLFFSLSLICAPTDARARPHYIFLLPRCLWFSHSLPFIAIVIVRLPPFLSAIREKNIPTSTRDNSARLLGVSSRLIRARFLRHDCEDTHTRYTHRRVFKYTGLFSLVVLADENAIDCRQYHSSAFLLAQHNQDCEPA